jgi:hypothetical protein
VCGAEGREMKKRSQAALPGPKNGQALANTKKTTNKKTTNKEKQFKNNPSLPFGFNALGNKKLDFDHQNLIKCF